MEHQELIDLLSQIVPADLAQRVINDAAELEMLLAAQRIQRAWRSCVVRRENITRCADCNRSVPLCLTDEVPACNDWNCCKKRVCRLGCIVQCTCGVQVRSHEDEGWRRPFPCLECGEILHAHCTWYDGLTPDQWRARYDP